MCFPRQAVRPAAHGVDEGAKAQPGSESCQMPRLFCVCQFVTHQCCWCFVMKSDTMAVCAWSRDPSEWHKVADPYLSLLAHDRLGRSWGTCFRIKKTSGISLWASLTLAIGSLYQIKSCLQPPGSTTSKVFFSVLIRVKLTCYKHMWPEKNSALLLVAVKSEHKKKRTLMDSLMRSNASHFGAILLKECRNSPRNKP